MMRSTFTDWPEGKVVLWCLAVMVVVPFFPGAAQALGLDEQIGSPIANIAELVAAVTGVAALVISEAKPFRAAGAREHEIAVCVVVVLFGVAAWCAAEQTTLQARAHGLKLGASVQVFVDFADQWAPGLVIGALVFLISRYRRLRDLRTVSTPTRRAQLRPSPARFSRPRPQRRR